MKNLIDKATTIQILQKANLPVPKHYIVHADQLVSENVYPWFVKPRFESESTGISEESIVHSDEELKRRLSYIHYTFRQSALVEEYLPGREFTVTVLGNGENKKVLPVLNIIDRCAFRKYPLVTVEAKINNYVTLTIPDEKSDEAVVLATAVAEELGCFDHVRIDMREDVNGCLRILEVNGIPGLNPIKSRSLHTYELYFQENSKEENFRKLINTIVDSAIMRCKNKLPGEKYTAK